MSSDEKRKKTVSVRIPSWLHPIVSRYAAEEGISQSDAMGRMFQDLYSTKPGAGDFLVEPTEEGKKVAQAPSSPDISDTLKKTVGDLTAVRTINALSKDFPAGGEQREGERLTTREVMDYRAMGVLPIPGGQPRDSAEMTKLTGLVTQLQTNIQTLQTSMLEKETERLKETIKTYEDRDKRAAEFAPLYDQIGKLNDTIGGLKEQIAGIGSTTPPDAKRTSDILELATSIKDGMEKMAENIGKGQLGLSEVDTLIATVEKLKGILPTTKEESELSPTTMAISAASEVGREIIKEYGKIRRHEEEEDLSTGRKAPVKQRVIERQVLHYVNRALESGKGEIDAYVAAEELGCTPEEVLIAVESLTKKGLIRYEKPSETRPRDKEERGIPETSKRLPEQQLRKLEADGYLITE